MATVLGILVIVTQLPTTLKETNEAVENVHERFKWLKSEMMHGRVLYSSKRILELKRATADDFAKLGRFLKYSDEVVFQRLDELLSKVHNTFLSPDYEENARSSKVLDDNDIVAWGGAVHDAEMRFEELLKDPSTTEEDLEEYKKGLVRLKDAFEPYLGEPLKKKRPSLAKRFSTRRSTKDVEETLTAQEQAVQKARRKEMNRLRDEVKRLEEELKSAAEGARGAEKQRRIPASDIIGPSYDEQMQNMDVGDLPQPRKSICCLPSTFIQGLTAMLLFTSTIGMPSEPHSMEAHKNQSG